ncbi:MAG: PHP domain-containing protein, partial [Clostridia bacterium]|nr:PHP domain-containing protein [Clostridia bacterium]
MIYYDFHIHSALSPCGDEDMTPNNIVNMAALGGLDVIAISDHNTIGNVASAIKVGEECGI